MQSNVLCGYYANCIEPKKLLYQQKCNCTIQKSAPIYDPTISLGDPNILKLTNGSIYVGKPLKYYVPNAPMIHPLNIQEMQYPKLARDNAMFRQVGLNYDDLGINPCEIDKETHLLHGANIAVNGLQGANVMDTVYHVNVPTRQMYNPCHTDTKMLNTANYVMPPNASQGHGNGNIDVDSYLEMSDSTRIPEKTYGQVAAYRFDYLFKDHQDPRHIIMYIPDKGNCGCNVDMYHDEVLPRGGYDTRAIEKYSQLTRPYKMF